MLSDEGWQDAPTATRTTPVTTIPTPLEWADAPIAHVPEYAPVSFTEWEETAAGLAVPPDVPGTPKTRKPAKRRRDRDVRLTTDDVEILELLWAHRCATKEQLARLLDRTVWALAKRLPRLVAAGLLQEERIGQRNVYAVTALALRNYLGVNKTSIRFPGNLRHALSLTDLYLKLKDDPRLYDFVSDREMRSAAAKLRDPFKLRKDKMQREIAEALQATRGSGEFLPDLKARIVGDDRWIYFEYERSLKSIGVTQRKLRHYLADHSVLQVVYFVPPKTDVATSVRSAARGLTLDDPRRVKVIDWVPVEPAAQELKVVAPRRKRKSGRAA